MNAVAPKQTEKQFQAAVIEYAKLNGWRVFHPFDSRRSEPGWPDLTLVRDGWLVFAELKAASGVLAHAQREWLSELQRVASGRDIPVAVYLWYPSNWATIESVLGR